MYKPRIASCGRRIAQALNIRDMKQSELCKLAKVPKSSLSLYLSEAYEPKQDRIYAMAKALNVSEAWLMGYDVPMEKEKALEQTELSEGERIWLQLYNKLSERTREAFITMADAFDRLPEEVCEFYLASLQGVLANQKTKQEQ